MKERTSMTSQPFSQRLVLTAAFKNLLDNSNLLEKGSSFFEGVLRGPTRWGGVDAWKVLLEAS